MNEQVYPKLSETLRGGVILKLPLTMIREELEGLIDLSMLESDSTLVDYLDLYLAQVKANQISMTLNSNHIDLMSTALYKSWSIDYQQ